MTTRRSRWFTGWVTALAAGGAMSLAAAGCVGTGASNVADAADLGGTDSDNRELGSEVAVGSATPTVPRQPADGLLYVAEARAASVTGEGAEQAVTLTEAHAEVLWFQDRPGRKAGELRMSEFVDQWDDLGFRSDPPNAVIRHDGDDLGSVVEMRDPVWDQPNGTLRFTAVPAEGVGPLPVLMSDVSVFIDDGGSTYETATLQVSNAAPGQRISVAIVAGGSSTPAWSAGESYANNSGLQLTSDSGVLPLSSFSVDSSSIEMETTRSGGSGALSFRLDLFLVVPDGTTDVRLRSDSDPGVEVTVSTGNSVPQVVNPTETPFSLQP